MSKAGVPGGIKRTSLPGTQLSYFAFLGLNVKTSLSPSHHTFPAMKICIPSNGKAR